MTEVKLVVAMAQEVRVTGEGHTGAVGVMEMICTLIGWWLHRAYVYQNTQKDTLKMDNIECLWFYVNYILI